MKKRILSLLLVIVMVLGMFPTVAMADAAIPFTVTVNDTAVTDITVKTLTWAGWSGSVSEVTCYEVAVPESAAEATLKFEDEKQWSYYDSTGNYVGAGDSSWTSSTEHTVAIQDSNGDGELDGVSVQVPNAYSTEFYIQFCYGSSEDGEDAPFLNIKIGETEVTEENISYKGIFKMGDYAEDEQQGTGDTYDYVHEVPYYHVIVPCGTESVDVTYSAETDIMNYGSDAYGYKTDLEVDAVSSATVRGTTFKDGYTRNEDGTQTVVTPVKGYTFDAEGNGHAITLEETNAPFAAVCLFSFAYDGINHKYVDGVCVCGAKDPDSAVSIPAGLNIVAISPISKIEKGDVLSYKHWGAEKASESWIVTIPAGTKTVNVTFRSDTVPTPYNDYQTGVLKLSGGWLSYNAEDEAYKMDGKNLDCDNSSGDPAVTLDAASMIENGNYYGVYNTSYGVQYLLGFKYPEGAHVHSYTEEVTTEPTCTEPGVKTFTCSCNDSYTEEVPAAGHSYGDGVETTAATCVADGVKTFTCANCTKDTEGHTKTEKIGKLGHDYDDGEETRAATCTEAGEKLFTCTREGCTAETEGHTKTETVPASGHNYENGTCTVCGDKCPQQDEAGVYQIGTVEELLWFANAVNNGQTAIDGKLTADIDLTGVEWTGIGTSSNRFAGIFDGNGKTVTFDKAPHGLVAYAFGASASDPAVIKNVTTAGTINGWAGVVEIARSVAYGKNAYVRIQKCINLADVTSTDYAGGIVADARGDVQIAECANLGQISGNAGDRSQPGVGGIVGYIQGYPNNCSLTDCYNLGKIVNGSGDSLTGGLIGNMYNAVSLTNGYNAGEVHYAIAGRVFNKTNSISNVYYLATKSPESIPASEVHDSVQIASKTLEEIVSAEFAVMLGEAFQQSCPAPVFTWQTAAEHQTVDGVCQVCGLGSKATYGVTWDASEAYTVNGEATVIHGEDYTFTVTINTGYETTDSFKVTVFDEELKAVDGVYTVPAAPGPLYIKITGVQKIPDSYKVSWSDIGKGFRVVGAENALTDQDYTFTVTMHENFQKGEDFAVKANGNALTPDANGTYTIEKVHAEQTITVSGVEAKPYSDTVSVTLTATKGLDTFFRFESDTIAAMNELEVPYFDLALYGLEKYYYNPYCYVDEAGNIKPRQEAGTRESAYGHVTAIHAFIYATETLCLEYGPEVAGTGKSYEMGVLDDYVSWTQNAGSSFMNLWGFGTNLNYYVNYEYPLAYPKWGATSDQIVLEDGDVISIHMITGNASGSEFQFFVVNDADQQYTIGVDQVDSAVVTRGEPVDLTLFRSVPTGQYTTSYNTLSGKQVYWIDEDNFDLDVDGTSKDEEEYNGWNKTFNGETMVTDQGGKICIDTASLKAGTYYFAVTGDVTKGGTTDGTGFVSKGGEAGPALFKLTVNANPLTEAKAAAKEEIAGYKNANDYREAQKTELAAAIEAANEAIDAAETVEAVEEAVAAAKAEMDKIKTDSQLTEEEEAAAAAALAQAKAAAKEEIAGYKNANDYREAQKTELAAAIEAANEAIDAAETVEAVEEAVAAAKTAMDAIKTDAELDKEEESKPSEPEIPTKPHKPVVKPVVKPVAPKMAFIDVTEGDWFYDSVKQAYENGLIDGMTATTFDPNGKLTIAQAIKLAAALHQLEKNGKVTLKNGSDVWYSTYVSYAIANGIIDKSYADLTDAQLNAAATRSEFVSIFHGAKDFYAEKNNVADNAIPDVKMGDKYADEIYEFYRAGILTGNDAAGTFAPDSNIKRSEVAAILIRMFDVSARQAVTLK